MIPQAGADLILVLCLMAALAVASRRRWIKPNELPPLGLAIVFFCTAIVLRLAIGVTRPLYSGRPEMHLLVSSFMVLPLTLAMAYGILLLYRSVAVKTVVSLTAQGKRITLLTGSFIGAVDQFAPDAIVVPAAPDLRMRGSVASEVRSEAGIGVEREACSFAPAALAGAIVSGAGRLKAKHLIHAVVWGKTADAEVIVRGIANSVHRAASLRAQRVLIPALGSGSGAISASQLAPRIVDTLLSGDVHTAEILIVAAGPRSRKAYEQELLKHTSRTGV